MKGLQTAGLFLGGECKVKTYNQRARGNDEKRTIVGKNN